MTTMIAEVYEAFISVGIKAEKAKAAAIALSREAKTESQEVKTDLKEDIQEIKIRIQKMDKELAVLKWMVGGSIFSAKVFFFIKTYCLFQPYKSIKNSKNVKKL